MIELYYWTPTTGTRSRSSSKRRDFPTRSIRSIWAGGTSSSRNSWRFRPTIAFRRSSTKIQVTAARRCRFSNRAILLYLAEKTGKFLPRDLRGRIERLEWLFWQVGGLGPMAGQNHHFKQYALEKLVYAIDRYVNETNRLYAVLNKRLVDRAFVAGAYSIADMAAYHPHESQGQKLEDFPHLKRWFEAIRARPATERAYAKAAEINQAPIIGGEESRKILFGQTAANVK